MNEVVQSDNEIWVGDLLGRKSEGDYLRRYIERLYDADKKDQASFVLNINSEWGHGKTWFLKNLYRELNKNHAVIYFDAWKNDFSNDALLSFVSVVCDELSKMFWKDKPVLQTVSKLKAAFPAVSKVALPILLSILVKQLTGKALEDLQFSDDLKGSCVDASDEFSKVISSSAIDGFLTQRNAIDGFTSAVQSLVNEISKSRGVRLPICIMVDELDRCRPTYAIELLEAIKHLFAVKGIFFIVATDTSQLAHSIKAVYGEGFNANSYLKRFFSSEYILVDPDYKQFSEFLFSGSDLTGKVILPGSRMTSAGFFACCSEFFLLSLRDQEQVFGVLKVVLLAEDAEKYHLPFLLLLIVLKHKFIESYTKLKVNPRNESYRQMVESFTKNGEWKDCAITIWQVIGNTGDSISLKQIFDFYFRLAEMDFNGSVLYSELSPGARFEKTILASVTDNTFTHSKKFSDYFSLVDQAGRFVS